jgi:hypothetical protein
MADFRMLLPALEFLEREDMRDWRNRAGDEAQRDLVVRLMIEEPAAIGAVSESGQPCVWITARNLCFSGSMSHSSLMPMP